MVSWYGVAFIEMVVRSMMWYLRRSNRCDQRRNVALGWIEVVSFPLVLVSPPFPPPLSLSEAFPSLTDFCSLSPRRTMRPSQVFPFLPNTFPLFSELYLLVAHSKICITRWSEEVLKIKWQRWRNSDA